jgi:site-specific DNA-methyltransferase (cytosine-N4-specific)
VGLSIKRYLQPFERELAKLEVIGLGLTDGIHHHSSFIRRSQRLSYFDLVDAPPSSPLTQALRESATASNGHARPMAQRRVLRFGPHGFHEYRGKFFPQLVRSLCNAASLEKGATVLDPMCGSGTTLVEARALDLKALGIDRNPLSRLISQVKTDAVGWTKEVRSDVESALDEVRPSRSAELPWDSTDTAYLSRWFHPDALQDVGKIVRMLSLLEEERARDFASVCLSNVLRQVSYQKEDDLRVRKVRKTYSKGDAYSLYQREVERNMTSIARLVDVDGGHSAPFHVKDGDARHAERAFPQAKGRVDAIITSPPYAMALPYLDTDRLSLIALGLLGRANHRKAEDEMIGTREITERKRRQEWERYERHRAELPGQVSKVIDRLAVVYHGEGIGFRRRNLPALLARYCLDMQDVLRNMHRMLAPDAPAFVVVGTNSTVINGSRFDIETDILTMQIAEGLGFEADSPINMELLVSRDAFKKNRGAREQILRLRKA